MSHLCLTIVMNLEFDLRVTKFVKFNKKYSSLNSTRHKQVFSHTAVTFHFLYCV